MSEYIVRETGFPGVIKQEIVGELVRCKDCKHSEKSTIPYRDSWCEVNAIYTDSNYFCADGERRIK